ncbi:MAG TPA: ECF-type sigma factor [Bryobacteraceae bacterium]|jgi:RNA polymerase sigma factor (TIGR02999 family)|nr:ECF-type sigma factor [Bryobacteraceae bacterium]
MPQDSALPGEITALLTRWSEGDRAALTSLASLAYDDLRAIATGFLRREGRDHTLQATALVNELYLRLVRQRGVHLADRTHFYTLAAMMMRRILSDYARQSHAQKRPGGQQIRIPLHEDLAWIDAASDELLALDQALDELESMDERAVRIIDLRFFLGCTNEETAGLLSVSRATVDRDLEFAKTWLYRRLSTPVSPTVSTAPPGGLP